MRKHTIFSGLLMLCMAFMGLGKGYAQSAWDFTSLGSGDQTNMGQDSNWKKDSSKDRWSYTAAQTEAPLMANGAELTITQGLLFTTTTDDNNGSVRFGLGSDARMWANGTKVTVIIPNLKKGMFAKVADNIQQIKDSKYLDRNPYQLVMCSCHIPVSNRIYYLHIPQGTVS